MKTLLYSLFCYWLGFNLAWKSLEGLSNKREQPKGCWLAINSTKPPRKGKHFWKLISPQLRRFILVGFHVEKSDPSPCETFFFVHHQWSGQSPISLLDQKRSKSNYFGWNVNWHLKYFSQKWTISLGSLIFAREKNCFWCASLLQFFLISDVFSSSTCYQRNFL